MTPGLVAGSAEIGAGSEKGPVEGGWLTNWCAVIAIPRTLMKVTAAAETICIPVPCRTVVVRAAITEAMAAPTTNAAKQRVRWPWEGAEPA